MTYPLYPDVASFDPAANPGGIGIICLLPRRKMRLGDVAQVGESGNQYSTQAC